MHENLQKNFRNYKIYREMIFKDCQVQEILYGKPFVSKLPFNVNNKIRLIYIHCIDQSYRLNRSIHHLRLSPHMALSIMADSYLLINISEPRSYSIRNRSIIASYFMHDFSPKWMIFWSYIKSLRRSNCLNRQSFITTQWYYSNPVTDSYSYS